MQVLVMDNRRDKFEALDAICALRKVLCLAAMLRRTINVRETRKAIDDHTGQWKRWFKDLGSMPVGDGTIDRFALIIPNWVRDIG